MRLRAALLIALFALALPVPAHAAGLFVLSGPDASNPANSLAGLISLDDGGGELQDNVSGGAVIAGTGVGPIVYNGGGSGSLRQYSGGTYRTITNSIPAVTSMTQTGRGLVVAIGNKLQYVDGVGNRSDVAHGTLAGGDSWVAIATAPNGHLIGWSWNNGWGQLWDLNLGSGATSSQDFTGTTNDPLFDNRDNGFLYGAGPVGNAGDIAVDGQGGIWVANALGDGSHAQIQYAPPGGSLNLVAANYYKPHITATGDGKAYASTSDYSSPGYISDVYRFPGEAKVTSAGGKLRNSALFDLAVDRCYAACAVTPPNVGGAIGTQKVSSPSKSVKLGKKGLYLKLKCSVACTVTVTGKLVFGKAKKAKKAAASKKKAKASPNTIKKTTAKLKAGKAKTVVLKLSKKQRRNVKRALRRKRKVYAKLKIVVTAPGVKTVTKRPKLRVH
jgi:hypothetical protein